MTTNLALSYLLAYNRHFTTVVFATDVELVRVSLDDFRWEAVFNGVGCAGVLQRVDGVPFGPDFEGVHGDS